MTRSTFEDLVKQLSRKLYSYAFRLLRNREEAEDTVQEIFIRLWKMGDKLDEYNSLEALATTLTRNYCIDFIRKRRHGSSGDLKVADTANHSAPSPQEQLEANESGTIIRAAIDKLPEAYREVLKLRDIDGISYEEIAGLTGQNINTIRVTISRARKMVRDEYNRHHYERKGIEKITGKVL